MKKNPLKQDINSELNEIYIFNQSRNLMKKVGPVFVSKQRTLWKIAELELTMRGKGTNTHVVI